MFDDPPSHRNSGEIVRLSPSLDVSRTLGSIDDNARYKAMVKYLYGRVSSSLWLPAPGIATRHDCYGVLLRKTRGVYVCEPSDVAPVLLAAVQKLNVEVAFTMSTETTHVIFSTLKPHQTDLRLGDGSQVQVVESMADIAMGSSNKIKKFQYTCLVRREQVLLVWHDDMQKVLPHAADIEGKLLALIWGTGASPFSLLPGSISPSPAGSIHRFGADSPTMKKGLTETTEEVSEFADEEKGSSRGESLARPLVFTSAVFVGLGLCLIVVLLCGFATSHLIFEALTDGNYIRMALLAAVPFLMLFGLFFTIVIFTDLFQMMGPISSVQSNSRFYSATRPSISRAYSEGFEPPHITIQMPVYKESLAGVIIPTVTSLKAAISHYESHGGSASIFVNDDGLRYLSEEEAQERVDFYHDNNIGWVARPKNNEDGYVRKGKFKKASNMNFALNISNKVEDVLQTMFEAKIRTEKTDLLEEHEEDRMYQTALAKVLAEDSRATAQGNIRVGKYILIIDSDTRVPVDCLLYGAAEMFFSPEVAIVQHSAGVMQVVGDYFENGIAFFTDLIYSSVRFSVGQGEVAPFVGHNAFLRWEAVQSVGRKEDDGYVAYWSESHVSEDFDIALRLQIAGNVVRLASYHGQEFKEGVSLTIYDELARWEKYSYGCSELVFHPLYTWLWRGPFTPLFRTFIWSDVQMSSKITILGYIASYYAIASGLPLTVLNYFLIGWFNGALDKFYVQSWNVFLGLLVVFSGMGNICLAVLRYRLGEKALMDSLLENFKWMTMYAIFFGGLSFHLNLSILAHLLSINMEWGATAKEAEASNFFKEMPKIFKSFKWMYMVLVPCVAGMIYLGFYAPRGWEIRGVTATVPLAVNLVSHALLPFVLNPSLMIFNY
ncbi:hypothetical protein B0A49_06523 [Cryomyces minteri]|uniref:Uncharacterized protein n=1 Tax=Cryomyces minteri TaxID=331657 RepID=A0A4U0WZZ9_9PEZI|nr:hypothetical protein B0A49_09533 [Cryomyces minteri]TKA64496.1 hypothetical protein B0A49_08708 [Cryomyces minteri]TKA68506.1 hypothetical protein B0A49_06523 [Cryomyces minteri]